MVVCSCCHRTRYQCSKTCLLSVKRSIEISIIYSVVQFPLNNSRRLVNFWNIYTIYTWRWMKSMFSGFLVSFCDHCTAVRQLEVDGFFFSFSQFRTAMEKQNGKSVREQASEQKKIEDENLRDNKEKKCAHLIFECVVYLCEIGRRVTYQEWNKIKHRKSIIKLTNEKYKFVWFLLFFSLFLCLCIFCRFAR